MSERELFERCAELFLRASKLPGHEVAAFLDRECAGDPLLRAGVLDLLKADDQESVLRTLSEKLGPMHERLRKEIGERPTLSLGTPRTGVWEAPQERAGDLIGRYKLLELIGEGGFGRVWVAEQREPVQRRVALKVIKAGMDTRQVVARFEQERQALAVMDHPGIAKVFDAGATETGRPFFVMELCKGDPISVFCDKHTLTVVERLALLAQVCTAVQHAHTKGIIHRDIKPSNVLVSMQDGRPLAKVIDFGIAKATSDRLIEKTLFTEHRQLIGTPEYMSPEQAEGSLDLDTRTDVYSLGVLLYELLTGSTPFSSNELRSAAFGEIQRIIREVDPPRPSTRLSQNAAMLAQVAHSRKTDPGRLGGLVRGELDWIVMKALDKDRARRYESPSGLAADLQRYLSGEAVHAAPPGRWYRLTKFVRRNRGLVGSMAAVALALSLGVVGIAWQAVRVSQQRDRAIAAEALVRARADELQIVSDFQADMLKQIDAAKAGELLAADLRDRFAAALAKGSTPEAERGERSARFAEDLAEVNATDAAAAIIDRTILSPSVRAIDARFANQPLIAAKLRYTLATLYRTLGLYEPALDLARAADNALVKLQTADHADTITSGGLLGSLLEEQAQYDEALAIQRRCEESSRRVFGPDHPETLNSMSNLGNLLRGRSKFDEAEPLLRGALEGRRRVLGNTARETLVSLNTLGQLLIAQGKIDGAAECWKEAFETGVKTYGREDPDVLIYAANMGGLMTDLGRYDEAEQAYRSAVEGFRRVRGEEHPYTLMCMRSLAQSLASLGRTDEAIRTFRDVHAALLRVMGPRNPETLDAATKLARELLAVSDYDGAEPLLEESLRARREILGEGHRQTIDSTRVMIRLLAARGKFRESEELARSCEASARATLGPEHPLYLIVAHIRAGTLARIGAYDEALARFAEVEESMRRLTPGSLQLGFLLSTKAACLLDVGRASEAEAASREAVEILTRTLPAGEPDILEPRLQLADASIALGKLDQAGELLGEVGAQPLPDSGLGAMIRFTQRTLDAKLAAARGQHSRAERELLALNQEALNGKPRSVVARLQIAGALAWLYEQWHTANPSEGHDAPARTWRAERARLMEVEPVPAAQPAMGTTRSGS